MSTRAALYARISQDDAHLERGVTRQLEDARELAQARGWDIVASYADHDVSAYNGAAREQYGRLMADAAAGRFDRIVVFHTSRLWRSRRERAADIEALAKAKVSVTAVRGPDLDLASASGRMLAGIIGEFDTAESEIKGERVARAALQRAQEGRANGAVSFGWRREHDTDEAGRIVGFRDVEEPAEADVVREIVQRLLAGDTVRGIADDLERRGVPTPSRKPGVRWRHTTVRKLALRPANAGLRVHHGQVIGPASWPAIVTPDEHERVTALLTAPRRTMTRDAARRHLLSYGIGQCGVCGSVLRVARKRSAGREYILYVCEDKGCVGRSVERVDELVGAVVVERLSRPDARDVLIPDDSAAGEAAERVETIRARLDTAADQYADGAIDAQQLARITERLRPDLDRAEADLRQARAATELDAIGDLLDGKAAEVWQALDANRRRAALRVLGLRVRIMPTRQGRGFNPRDVKIEWEPV